MPLAAQMVVVAIAALIVIAAFFKLLWDSGNGRLGAWQTACIRFAAVVTACIIVIVFALIAPVHAESFYPACLKPDGDWLHGVTRKECVGRDVKGRWYTNGVLKKARKVW